MILLITFYKILSRGEIYLFFILNSGWISYKNFLLKINFKKEKNNFFVYSYISHVDFTGLFIALFIEIQLDKFQS